MKLELLKNTQKTTDRERILIVGDRGTKKTSAIVQLAQLWPDIGVVVIDPDGGMPKIINRIFGGWDKVPNLSYYPVNSWLDIEAAYKEIKPALESGDWLCIDGAHHPWKMAREDYINAKFHKTLSEFKLDKMKKGQQMAFGALENPDWDMIKLMYNSVITNAIERQTCNVLFTVPVQPLIMHKVKQAGGVDKQVPLEKGIAKHWARLGYKPAGEKNLVGDVDTVLLLDSEEKAAGIRWTFESIGKDRNTTDKIEGGEFENLIEDYFKAIGRNIERSPGS